MFGSFQADFDFEGPDLIQAQQGHAFEHDERHHVLELLIRIVPEDNPLPFLVEEAVQSRKYVLQVAHFRCHQISGTG